MALSCGWPNGTHQEDGHCGDTATVAYVVKVLDVPLVNPAAEAHEAVLALCTRHAPSDG